MVALASPHDHFRFDPPDGPMTRLDRIRLMDWHTYAVHERMTTSIAAWTPMTQGEYNFTCEHWCHLVCVYRNRLKHLRLSKRWAQFREGEYAVQLRKAQNRLNAVQNDLLAIRCAWHMQGGV